ncbi:hypothetical protein IWQ57_003014 [Coemansia nantahalensis]|uniref:Uncharacterized protein n=1 Tax=Coemansia nantahalensis TaxID=2789366 RepID=A0ACC1JY77_9FUNG|nr:hypothetical protein IWQ57_003014 [Coemansia nantahalensis]
MADAPGRGSTSIALFVTQIVSAASGVVISASCLFLRKWHPPVAYTAAFNISFWIGVQAVITHTGSAISVRLPEASADMQRNKALVRFLVWAQFAMPLWFVFLNASIATDLMLSQLCRLGTAKLQAVHKWYLPVATTAAFALALPLLIYHSAYQPQANVFSVQFPSALSVTLYYILAFDVWLAAGIVYCFVVVSLVVGVLLVKLRRKRAAWRLQSLEQMENGWLPLTPAIPAATNQPPLEARHGTEQTISPAAAAIAAIAARDSTIDPNEVRTFALQTHPPVARTDSASHGRTVMSGVTFSGVGAAGDSGGSANPNSSLMGVEPSDPMLKQAVPAAEAGPGGPHADDLGAALAGQVADDDGGNGAGTRRWRELLRRLVGHAARCTRGVAAVFVRDAVRGPEHPTEEPPRQSRAATLSLSLSNLLTLPSLSRRSRTQMAPVPGTPPFRIPTLALVRLLLYPLIPILSFTLMCVVRWVWFRSNMPSRWEILNVVSGFLRALEGFLCLIVFLLNPALNRSFREIRKRNTPVFT